jgi:hypothetical protein
MNPTKKVDLEAFVVPGTQIDFSIKSVEDADEKRHRLRKEFLGFLVKDVGPYGLAGLVVAVIGVYSLIVLRDARLEVADREWARQSLTAILGGVVGVAFGKAAGK